MVAMDSSLFILRLFFYFPLKYDQIEEAQRNASGFDGMFFKIGHNFKIVVFKILFLCFDFEETFRKTIFEGEMEVPWCPDTS